MKDDDLRRRYDAQFRWEEGMLVYRHRQRGLPVEVSDIRCGKPYLQA